jgi:hypothetical protein
MLSLSRSCETPVFVQSSAYKKIDASRVAWNPVLHDHSRWCVFPEENQDTPGGYLFLSSRVDDPMPPDHANNPGYYSNNHPGTPCDYFSPPWPDDIPGALSGIVLHKKTHMSPTMPPKDHSSSSSFLSDHKSNSLNQQTKSERVGEGEMARADGLVGWDGINGAIGSCGWEWIEKEGLVGDDGFIGGGSVADKGA